MEGQVRLILSHLYDYFHFFITEPWLHGNVTFFKRAFTPDDPVQAVRDELDGSVKQVVRLVQTLAYVESGKHHKGKEGPTVSIHTVEDTKSHFR